MEVDLTREDLYRLCGADKDPGGGIPIPLWIRTYKDDEDQASYDAETRRLRIPYDDDGETLLHEFLHYVFDLARKGELSSSNEEWICETLTWPPAADTILEALYERCKAR